MILKNIALQVDGLYNLCEAAGTMTRSSSRPVDAIDQARKSHARTTIILVGVGDYAHLEPLDGPSADIGFLQELLTSSDISLFSARRVVCHLDITCEEFRQAILDYSVSCSSTVGDILILYFSGHGCVMRGNEFGFCLKDTKLDSDGNPLSLSVVSFSDVVRALEAYNIYPIIILDACYSGMAVSEVQNELKFRVTTPHAVISSSSYSSTSLDLPEGGAFTTTLLDILKTGLGRGEGSLWPYFTLRHLEEPLRDELIVRGLPLYQMNISTGLPRIPLASNTRYKPRIERFSPQFKGIILLLWNNGNPRSMNHNDFRNRLGTGATNNHSKLSYAPWDLLIDENQKDHRVLSDKGISFAKGDLKIPKIIFMDPETYEWKPYPGAESVNIGNIKDPTWK